MKIRGGLTFHVRPSRTSLCGAIFWARLQIGELCLPTESVRPLRRICAHNLDGFCRSRSLARSSVLPYHLGTLNRGRGAITGAALAVHFRLKSVRIEQQSCSLQAYRAHSLLFASSAYGLGGIGRCMSGMNEKCSAHCAECAAVLLRCLTQTGAGCLRFSNASAPSVGKLETASFNNSAAITIIILRSVVRALAPAGRGGRRPMQCNCSQKCLPM